MRNSSLNTFSGGLNLDTSIDFVKSNEYLYANNITVCSFGNKEAIRQMRQPIVTTSKVIGSVIATASGMLEVNGDLILCYVILYQEKPNTDKYKISAYCIDDPVCGQSFKLQRDIEVTMELGTNVKMKVMYESAMNTHVFVTSNLGTVYDVNLQKNYRDGDDCRLFPQAGAMPPPILWMYGEGSLPNGYCQYCYQWFTEYEFESPLSAFSAPIIVGSNGDPSQPNSGKSVTIRIQRPNTDSFTRIKIYRVHYGQDENGNEVINCYVVEDKKIPSGNYILFTDTENIPEKVITHKELLELQHLNVYQYKTFDIFKNRMYFANVVGDFITNDVFDARAYRSDKTGTVKLFDSVDAKECKLDAILNGSQVIDIEHDAQNPYTISVKDDNYMYTTRFNDIPEFGGSGLNVDYAFVRVPQWVDQNVWDTRGMLSNSGLLAHRNNLTEWLGGVSKNIGATSFSPIRMTTVPYTCSVKDGDVFKDGTINYNYNFPSGANHGDPYWLYMFKGYKQGEIYPFGIIFYDQNHTPSNVFWIGDIKIPYFNTGVDQQIRVGTRKESGYYSDCVMDAIGLRFKINLSLIPKHIRYKITAFEIVRCDRKFEDRTVLCQGLGSRLFEQNTTGITNDAKEDWEIYSPGLYPTSIKPNNSKMVSWNTGYDKLNPSESLFSVTSPDVFVNRSNAADLYTTAKYVKPITYVTSLIAEPKTVSSSDTINGVTTRTIFSNVVGAISYYTVPKDNTKQWVDFGGRFATTAENLQEDGTRENIIDFGKAWMYTTNEIIRNDNSKGYYHNLWCKYYTPVVNQNTTEFMSVNDVVFLNNWDPLTSIKTMNDSATVLGNYKISNVTSFKLIEEYEITSGQQTSYVKGFHFGAGSPKLVFSGDFGFNKLNPFGNKADDDNATIGTPYIHTSGQTIKLSDFSTFVNIPDNDSSFYKVFSATAPIVDVFTDIDKQYGGFDYQSRANRSYISIGCYKQIESDKDVYSINCFGGDTYNSIYHDLWCGFSTRIQLKDGKFASSARATVRASFPVETSVDLYRTFGEQMTSPDNLENRYLTIDPVEFSDVDVSSGYVQEKGLNLYSGIYTTHYDGALYIPFSQYSINDTTMPVRVLVTNTKNMGEVFDSFQNVLHKYYIDCPTEFGQILNLVSTEKTLYVIQEKAIGSIATDKPAIVKTESNETLQFAISNPLLYYTKLCDVQSHTLNSVSIDLTEQFEIADNLPIVIGQDSLVNKAAATNTLQHFSNVNKPLHIGNGLHLNQVWYCADDAETIIYNKQIKRFTSFCTTSLKFFQNLYQNLVGIDKDNVLRIINPKQESQTSSDTSATATLKFAANSDNSYMKVFDTVVIYNNHEPNDYKSVAIEGKCSTFRQGDVSCTNLYKTIDGNYYLSIGRTPNKERLRGRNMVTTLELTGNFNISQIETVYRT